MNETHLAAFAPNDAGVLGWYNTGNVIPHPGNNGDFIYAFLHQFWKTVFNPPKIKNYEIQIKGVNAGVMLMNLKGMREFGIEEKTLLVYQMHKAKIMLADQDIYNIFFSQYPGKF